MFERVWKHEIAALEQREKVVIGRVEGLHQKITELTDLARKAKNDHLRGIYEGQIEDTALALERERSASKEGLDWDVPYRTALQKATMLLNKPYNAWKIIGIEERHELFYFVFDDKLTYHPKTGYRTAEIPTAARLFEDFVVSNSASVDHTGFEPVTSPMPWERSTK